MAPPPTPSPSGERELAACDLCGRKTWDAVEVNRRCGMPQPTGAKCKGFMIDAHPSPPPPAPTLGERPVCGALKRMENDSPTCDLPRDHRGAHRWHGPSLNERIDASLQQSAPAGDGRAAGRVPAAGSVGGGQPHLPGPRNEGGAVMDLDWLEHEARVCCGCSHACGGARVTLHPCVYQLVSEALRVGYAKGMEDAANAVAPTCLDSALVIRALAQEPGEGGR